VNRLLVFALGGIFGAAALYWLAPRREPAPVAAVPVPASGSVATPAPLEPALQEPMPPMTAEPAAASTSAAVSSTTDAVSPIEGPPPAPERSADLGPLADPAPSAPTPTPALAQEPATDAPESSAEATVSSLPAPIAVPSIVPPPPNAAVVPEPLTNVTPGIPAKLMIPVEGTTADSLIDTFTQARGGGSRPHDAIDIMAPSGTPVRAVDDGKIAKLFLSKAGGITAYQFDPTEKFAYYYAHLERYADGLAEGQAVKRGDLIGYVGYTGNANPAGPHLHFAIVVLGPEKRWWEGTPINPYPVLIGATQAASAVASD